MEEKKNMVDIEDKFIDEYSDNKKRELIIISNNFILLN